MTSSSPAKPRQLPSHQQALRRCFEPHPVVHFVYSFALLFTVLSLFFWVGELIGSSPLWHSIASPGTTAVIALVCTVIDFVAARWRWSRDHSSSEDG
jgi:apolipoprotein N-acyltransferase